MVKSSLIRYSNLVFLKVERVLINLNNCIGIDLEREINEKQVEDRDCVFLYFPPGFEGLDHLGNGLDWLDIYELGDTNSVQVQILDEYADSVRQLLVSVYDRDYGIEVIPAGSDGIPF